MSVSEKMGPGWWECEHIAALAIRDEDDESAYLRFLERRIRRFPCKKCQNNAMRFMQTLDIDSYRALRDSDGRLLGMFALTVDFHNHANDMTGKPAVTFEEALEKWDRDVSEVHGPEADAQRVGPGWWANEHLTTLTIEDAGDESAYIRLFRQRIEAFPPKKCRERALRFIAGHDIDGYRGMVDRHGRRIGLFAYTVEMHNNVNVATNRPALTLDDALLVWDAPQPCSLDCDE